MLAGLGVHRSVLTASAACSVLAFADAAAAETARFDLDAQPARTGIPEFGRQASLQILAPERLVRGKTTKAVKGELEIRQALAQLLEGSGLRVASDDGRTLILAERERRRPSLRLALTGGAAGGPTATDANQHETVRLDEVIVTAQRREERLQDVPIAVTALSEKRLRQAGAVDTFSLEIAAPGLKTGASIGHLQPFIRGVGANASGPGQENPVAIYVDGVYYASAPSAILALNGVERVEVLKGPQGTLFGRNATGGLIQITTKSPGAEPEGDVALSYGDYSTFTADTYVSSPVADGLGASLALHYSRQGEGYGENLFTGADYSRLYFESAVRGKLVADIGNLRLALKGDYNHFKTNRQGGRIPPGEFGVGGFPPVKDPWDSNVNGPLPIMRTKNGGVSLHAAAPVGPGAFTSITAYRKTRHSLEFDFDGTPIPFATALLGMHDWQFSQELQIAASSGSRINWVAGVYYFKSSASYDPVRLSVATLPLPIVVESTTQAESVAAYAQATFPVGDRTNMTAGFRYTSEERNIRDDLVAAGHLRSPSQSKTFQSPSWRLALDHHLSGALMVYASYNRGFKSGGYNANFPADQPYNPEVIDAFEIGLKSELFDRRLRFNTAAFYYDYSDLQVQQVTAAGAFIRNGAKAEIYGLDVEVTALASEALRIDAGLSLIAHSFTEFPNAPAHYPLPTGGNAGVSIDAKGNRLPMTPDWSFNLGATYTVPLDGARVELDGVVHGSGRYHGEADNVRRQDAYSELNASASWIRDDGLRATLWGRNLTDEAIVLQFSGTELGSNVTYKPPRTFGVTVGYAF